MAGASMGEVELLLCAWVIAQEHNVNPATRNLDFMGMLEWSGGGN